MSGAKLNAKSINGVIPRSAEKSREENPSTVEVASDIDNQTAPPDFVDPDPKLTSEEVELARKRYLLKRFWISALCYWRLGGDRLAWPLSIGLLTLIFINVGFQYGINVWNRSIFDAIEQRNARTIYFLSAVFLPLVLGTGSLVVAQVFLRMTI